MCMESAGDAERAVAFGEAISMLERALPHVTDPFERARVICRIGQDHWLNGESAVGAGFLAEGIEALERARGASSRRHEPGSILGRCLWEGEKPAEARAEYVRARDVLEAEGPSAELAMAHMRLAGLDAFELDYQGCLEHSRRAVEIAEQAGADYERVWALGFLGSGCSTPANTRGASGDGRVLRGGCRQGVLDHRREHDLQRRLDPYAHAPRRPRGAVQRFEEMPDMRANRASKVILSSYVALAGATSPKRSIAPAGRWSSTRTSATGR